MLARRTFYYRFQQRWSRLTLYQRWRLIVAGMLFCCWCMLVLSIFQAARLDNSPAISEPFLLLPDSSDQSPSAKDNDAIADPMQRPLSVVIELDKTIPEPSWQRHWPLLVQTGLFFIFALLAIGLINSWRQFLMMRLPALLTAPALEEDGSVNDEFSEVENTFRQLSRQQAHYQAEIARAQRTDTQFNRLTSAQQFLADWVNQLQQEVPNEASQMRMLYSLERALDLQNVALIIMQTTVEKIEETWFSHHPPFALNETQVETLLIGGMFSGEMENQERERVNITAFGFTLPNDKLGILLVEMPVSRVLDATEVTLLETLISLLAISYRYQHDDAEARRLAILEERSAIARELHDSLAQSLSFMKIQVSRLQSTTDPQKQTAVIKELREGLDNAYRELRELLSTFRAHMDLRGLGYAIQATIDEFSQRSSLQIKLDNRLVNCRLTVNEEFHVLHVLREALSNIVRHAGAEMVNILLTRRSSGEIELTIDDDGVGFQPGSQTYDHHGQAIMKERAQNLGGKLEVMSRRWGGTRVQLLFKPKQEP